MQDAAQEVRRSFVLNTSITEIMLLLFFLLLLLLTYFVAQRAEERSRDVARIEKLGAEKQDLEIRLQALEAQLNSLLVSVVPDQQPKVRQMLVSLSKLQFVLADKTQQLAEIENRLKAYERLAIEMQKGLPVERFKEEELRDIGRLASCGAAQERVRELVGVLAKERGSRSLTERDATQRIREAMDKVRRCGGKGEEFVACWRDNSGRIQYMFNTTLRAEGIAVERAWPDEREQEMAKYADARALVNRTVTLEELLEKTGGIFADSKTVPCRHFVRIYGKRAEMDPARFRDYRGIQDHFYHWSGVN